MKRISPTNPSLAVEIARLKAARMAYKARDKEIGKKMASKLFPESQKAKVDGTAGDPAGRVSSAGTAELKEGAVGRATEGTEAEEGQQKDPLCACTGCLPLT